MPIGVRNGNYHRIHEIRAQQERDNFKAYVHQQTIKVCDELFDIMGKDAYLAWIDTTPDENWEFFCAARKKLWDVYEPDRASQAAEAQEITDWLGEYDSEYEKECEVLHKLLEEVRGNPFLESAILGAWMKQNWNLIPEVEI